ncbi:MAG: type II secretion system F family protein [Actinomycetota bacterium]
MIPAIAFLGALGIVVLAAGLPPMRRARLDDRVEPYLSGLHGRPSNLLLRRGGLDDRPLLRRAAAATARVLPATHERLGDRLSAAGEERDPADFRLEQVIWGLISTVAVWVLVALGMVAGVAVDALALPLLTAIACAGGFFARDWWLGRQVEDRTAILAEELPTAIDLVTLSIVAGESVPAAFARVARSLKSEIGREFQRVVADIRAGSTSVEALDGMKQRVHAPGIARFSDALITGIERGSPLAEVLRAQADDGREARRRWLLEVGGRREVLMLVPVVFLIMPVVVVFTLLPGLVALDLLVP